MSPSAGQTEGEGEGVGIWDGEEEIVLEIIAVTGEEGVGSVVEVEGFCTIVRVRFSTACRGKLVFPPAKSLTVGGRSNKQSSETLDIPFVRVQSEL